MLELRVGLCPHKQSHSMHPRPNIIHCIGKDGAMGAGFAKGVPSVHKIAYRNQINVMQTPCCGFTTGQDAVYAHLITKDSSTGKPTIDTFQGALDAFVNSNPSQYGKTWNSPLIGCGLDRLKVMDVLPRIVKAADRLDIHWIIWLFNVSTQISQVMINHLQKKLDQSASVAQTG